MIYPNFKSAIRPVSHTEDPVSETPTEIEIEFSEQEDDTHDPELESHAPKPLSQHVLIVKDLDLAKQQSELLTSRLKKEELVMQDVQITKLVDILENKYFFLAIDVTLMIYLDFLKN